MGKYLVLIVSMVCIFAIERGTASEISDDSRECLECHQTVTPGIVGDWKKSLHARISPSEAMEKAKQARRISSDPVPEDLADNVVGCAECHNLTPDKHPDTVEHNGYEMHVVVSPRDCAVCHPVERDQFAKNIMSHAHGNLTNNSVFNGLAETINGVTQFDGASLVLKTPVYEDEMDSCLACHGTRVEVKEITARETVEGEMDFPVLSGWPNQGVGRINPDGSMGACTACHPRHGFSIATARKPATCSQCHKGPDVPAYPVYQVSKHGNIYSSEGDTWNFTSVPWQIGEDFTAPTCAVCHVSLTVDSEGEVIAERTHQMNDRLPWRIFGLIYSHSHPKSPDTTLIKSKDGLPLPTALDGTEAADYLIDANEKKNRKMKMQRNCIACHDKSWVEGHWRRFENTMRTADKMVLTSTEIMMEAWEQGIAGGLSENKSIFDEAIEKMWIEQWLFYANSTRFASAMMGQDYGVFANGRWSMAKNIRRIHDWLQFKLATKKSKSE